MTNAEALSGELDEAIAALTLLDSERLTAVEDRIRRVTAAQLAKSRDQLPELMEKHMLLGQLLDVTAANLKVLVSVLSLEARTEKRSPWVP